MDFLGNFINKLIKEAGMDKMPADFREEFSVRLRIEANKRLGLSAMAELKPEEIVEFEKLTVDNKDKPEVIFSYLSSHINNFQEKMTKALEGFASEVLARAEKLK